LEEQDRKLLRNTFLPILVAIPFGLLFGGRAFVYASAGTLALEIVIWGFNHSK